MANQRSAKEAMFFAPILNELRHNDLNGTKKSKSVDELVEPCSCKFA
jgi:hypothetical protein